MFGNVIGQERYVPDVPRQLGFGHVDHDDVTVHRPRATRQRQSHVDDGHSIRHDRVGNDVVFGHKIHHLDVDVLAVQTEKEQEEGRRVRDAVVEKKRGEDWLAGAHGHERTIRIGNVIKPELGHSEGARRATRDVVLHDDGEPPRNNTSAEGIGLTLYVRCCIHLPIFGMKRTSMGTVTFCDAL